jgi:hypothetical protein
MDYVEKILYFQHNENKYIYFETKIDVIIDMYRNFQLHTSFITKNKSCTIKYESNENVKFQIFNVERSVVKKRSFDEMQCISTIQTFTFKHKDLKTVFYSEIDECNEIIYIPVQRRKISDLLCEIEVFEINTSNLHLVF